MTRKAGLVNIFNTPYEKWSKRNTTIAERMDLIKNKKIHISEALEIDEHLIEVVSTPFEAASYILRHHSDNGLERHIERSLDADTEYQKMLNLMPQKDPDALRSYQGRFSESDWASADVSINAHGIEMAEGQYLFHGGHWISDFKTLVTSRPFSTSFCPNVALKNAEWRGKAYDAGRVDLMIISVTQPKIKAYAYSREGEHGHEKEVVFASGAQLTHISETYIANLSVSKAISGTDIAKKIVPAYIIEIKLS
ncbi:hypothetical protein [Pseudomonas oryzihabitans]|uniref:Uncharacterized protein n=1 Tax=Pseudomonas oryzihabitans TaxID=47885 RepID=A0AAJ2BH01_9PSED|nr:hypothetical protein [Pseudomonas psychrotolerans]MDR6234049.1 hypothetical protein [Pseudomonas psychrotolerans]MDR6356851.1 hypothetical protein [Pseudomonas psychrotolerans]